jgi:hypothetical protein
VRLLGPALNGTSDGEYRGTLMLHPGSGGLTAINVVGLEDYLRGVVPSEMPSSWPEEALRAQAVAARSYALATARTGGLFDQYPDQRSRESRARRPRATPPSWRPGARSSFTGAGSP